MNRKTLTLFDPALVKPAIAPPSQAHPRVQWRNPVMFVVYVGSILTTLLASRRWGARRAPQPASSWPSPCGCGSRCCSPTSPRRWPRAAARRRRRRCAGSRSKTWAKKLKQPVRRSAWHAGGIRRRPRNLRKARCGAGRGRRHDPADGEVIEGVASVDESAITGESAPVIRESGGDFSAVTGGTRVLSDWLVVRVGVNPGETFVDRMIAMVEERQAAEDTERDRADHPAGGADHRFPGRHGHAAAFSIFSVEAIQRGSRSRSPCWWPCWCA
jgi:K+-transporting ATPase ATPase B chain